MRPGWPSSWSKKISNSLWENIGTTPSQHQHICKKLVFSQLLSICRPLTQKPESCGRGLFARWLRSVPDMSMLLGSLKISVLCCVDFEVNLFVPLAGCAPVPQPAARTDPYAQRSSGKRKAESTKSLFSRWEQSIRQHAIRHACVSTLCLN